MVPPGDIFGLIPLSVGVYLAAAVAFGLHGYFLYQRFLRLIRLGRPAPDRRGQWLRRGVDTLLIVLGQRKVLQSLSFRWRDLAGIGHASIFLGFLSFLLSYLIFIFADSAWRPFSEKLLTPAGVKVYTMYLDVAALVVLSALAWALLRRWLGKPHRLTFDLTRSFDAIIIVSLIAGLMLLTLLAEAFYVAAGGAGPASEGFVGSALGRTFISLGLSRDAANTLQGLSWWLHLGVILGFAVYIPYSKHMHMIASPINAFFRRLEPRGTLPDTPDLEKAEHFGAGRVQDFTWKQLLDGYACAVCGRCTDSCPANLTGKVLSPMHIVENTKAYLLENRATLIKGQEPEKPLIGTAIPEQALWDCVTCGACVYECPVTVEHIDSIVDMRRHLVMEKSQMPEGAMNALLSMEQRGHPWRGTTFSRTDWAQGLDIKTMAEDSDVEVLFWVGCTPALEERSQKVARAMAAVLKAAGVRFAILGNEETCTGDPARRMGNEYLFQVMARQNIETLKRYDVKKVVTICPHCFNTMRNEYPKLGASFQVVHYAEYVSQLIREGRLKPVRTIDTTLAYHDSCYLGRHNNVYDPPREIARAIPGLKLVEIQPRCRERAMCCGAGGGHLWIEEVGGKERINRVRTDQFLETKADTVGVSCPYCLQMFKEGIESRGLTGQKRERDLLELLAESVQPDGSKS
ncbi:MAG: (Fe-S)-binding protein [Chloroflexi bacterium]|nr:(Fe-S)-binding protein [Chloroflexota bacterium]